MSEWYMSLMTAQTAPVVSLAHLLTEDNKDTLLVYGKYYNEISGLYEKIAINDGQLGK